MTVVFGYLAGSIPTGFLAGKLKGVDIRRVGSGNIGATNVFRNLGKTAGVLVLLIDGVKGWLACRYAPDLAQGLITAAGIGVGPEGGKASLGGGEDLELLRMAAGFAAILGHNYTCWLSFNGGKGIATSAGVLVVLMPGAFVASLVSFVVAFGLTRYVSLGSISAAIALPVAAAWLRVGGPMITLAVLMGALAIYKHRANIARLIAGTEPKLGRKPSATGKGTET